MKTQSVIGNIAKDLGLDLRTLSARKARADSEGTRKRYCDINLSTGDLITSERIDRENLCGKKPSCVLKVDLVLENPLELHRVSLHIQDVNDNSPKFKKDLIEMEINVTYDFGHVSDDYINVYSIDPKVELVLDNTLDREKRKELNLLLTALDGGSPQRSGTVVIHVTVLDANDNAPVFSQAVYKASLPENSPPDTIVINVSATDADEGVNGDVTYQFGHVSDDYVNLFSIDPKTGEIRVTGVIDFEELSTFEMRVQAKDVIYLQSLTEPIPENVSPGTEVGIINARDADIGQNAVQRYNLEKNEYFILAADNKAELVLENTLDREKQKELNLLLTALDGGSPQRSGTVVIHVTVLDANDNAPVFSQAVYKVSLPENSLPDTIVSNVSATDADEGVNGDVTYDFGHVSEDDVNVFSIDPKTGEIRVTGVIDFEEINSFEIIVEAKDGLGLTSYAKVMIDITDVNDNAPVIYLQSLTNPIPENVSPGTEVGIINVQDRDSENNGQQPVVGLNPQTHATQDISMH
uniref:Cadherin domain-containing protein n=1 Tax=Acanthochromis polyacanthus TaxID=80966 RepID=A0A3Q1G6F0_9TELE